MREIILDTETTGLDFNNGDRIVEVGVIELENHVQTGNYFHYYLNPEKDSDPQAFKIHGLNKEFLKDKPKFIDIADQFMDFISDSKIIIHNAPFDLGFINSELRRCNKVELDNVIIDTLLLAKKMFVGQSVSLDSLCRKFNIDITDREIHGALKDAKLLSHVYLELIGGKQTKLDLVRYLHAACFSPVKSTWMKAIKNKPILCSKIHMIRHELFVMSSWRLN